MQFLSSVLECISKTSETVANSLLYFWCQSDCPPQKEWGDSSHCSELYPLPSCCEDCCEQSEVGSDLPLGTTAAQACHQGGGGCRSSSPRRLDVCRWPWWEPLDCEVRFQERFQLCAGIRCCWRCVSWLQLLYAFVHSSYSSPSSQFWHDSVIQSAEGVQQGDALGPLLFYLSIHDLCSQLRSEFNVWYLDDSFVEGALEDIWHDLEIYRLWGWNWACIWTVRSLWSDQH